MDGLLEKPAPAGGKAKPTSGLPEVGSASVALRAN
jgi:hypothetical protein